MIRPVIILLTVFATSCKYNKQEYFTGTIEYAYTYASDSLNADSLSRLRPSKGIFRYDLQNYQSRFTGVDTLTCFYSGEHHKCLSKTGAAGNYECEDYSILNDSVLSFKLYDTEERILGYRCRILEMQKKNSWVRYHVSSDLQIAPATYTGHQSYNWDFYGEKTNGGLILKVEHKLKYFTLNGIATAVNKTSNNFTALEIDSALFRRHCK